ncbi:hypothetical protein P691DRAFT_670692 [Macrolepiota fuliginosa MF-IS2]|uniref:phosphatidylinositol-3,4,5-trisphosphate 3-phosphatase n=1 Tax=Macrolepiota fuliginosa MF-IS2 TaxID=1400762 RepID=A0A9P6C410_9AGAR|nr:hypothetical protein P691DRAFT_670692 [Macrolepiota fuliginosa MF-IS2]
MADYIRRLVSGPKARFRDEELKLELDLVYVTDQIIIMGYPASGFEGYYRNRREDVKKFLDHRHGKNYWIFNFCPLKENSYDAQYFDGRVSRYPFPDHHAPPLPILPLVAREMRAWLSGSHERVAVLHCKAGKGRSGTMACTYLLSLDEEPTPPKLQRSHTAKEWAMRRAEDTMDALPEDQDLDKMRTTTSPLLQPSVSLEAGSDTADILDPEESGGSPLVKSPGSVSPTSVNPEGSFTEALKGVLNLHTARRMKAPSDPEKKQKQGVSIPSQRRYLHYWSLCIANAAPAGFWSLAPSLIPHPSPPSPQTKKRVRLTEIKLRLREFSTTKLNFVKVANLVIDKTKGKGSGSSSIPIPITRRTNSSNNSEVNWSKPKNNGSTSLNYLWASLARYDDELITTLEKWEKHTRDEKGRLGLRRPGSERMETENGVEELGDIFRDGRWDQHKMVRSFGRLGEVGEATRTESRDTDKDERILTYTLRPLSGERWESIKEDMKEHKQRQQASEDSNLSEDGNQSVSDSDCQPSSPLGTIAAASSSQEQGVVLDAEREVRIKLYMGQVFMGWVWLIPAFHMPSLNNNDGKSTATQTQTTLVRKEIDFAIGLGTGIIDVEISMEWIVPPSVRQQAEAILVPGPVKNDEVDTILPDPPAHAPADDPEDELATI